VRHFHRFSISPESRFSTCTEAGRHPPEELRIPTQQSGSSPTRMTMVNETVCKVTCHNISRLIQSIRGLGTQAQFWKNEPKRVEKSAPCELAEAIAWM
jgi:hypothetical protein